MWRVLTAVMCAFVVCGACGDDDEAADGLPGSAPPESVVPDEPNDSGEDVDDDICSHLDAGAAASGSEAEETLSAVVDRVMADRPGLAVRRDALAHLYGYVSAGCPEHAPLILQYIAATDGAGPPG